jgi:beta-glucanase (GH16 family)
MKFCAWVVSLSFCLLISSYTIAVAGTGIELVPTFVENFDSLDTNVWDVGGWKEHGGQTSPKRCFVTNGMLNMVLRFDSATQSILSSAMQTKKTFLYGRWEARLKPSPVTGELNSFYTIDWGGGKGTKQEIDIEFLTFEFGKHTGKVHFAVHAAGLKSTETNPDIDLDFNPSDDFHVWGFEITPERIEWFVDGKILSTYKYNENAIKIDSPYQLKLNVRGEQKWIKGPPQADTDCIYQIDWIKFFPASPSALKSPPTH